MRLKQYAIIFNLDLQEITSENVNFIELDEDHVYPSALV
jgi:hypothetical protein